MKNISALINVVLLLAVAVLYYLHFSASNSVETKSESVILTKADIASGEVKIAFIDLEKLLVEYNLSADLNENYSQHMEKAQTKLDKKVSDYKKELRTYQEKLQRGGFLSQRSAENQKDALLEKQQELQILQMELENTLLEDQQKLNSQLYDSVMNYLHEYNQAQNFQYIFSKMDGGGLLIGDSTLEITNHVVNVLNQRYKSIKE